MIPKLLMLLVVFVTLLLIRVEQSQASMAKPGCQEICGNVSIPYPFGIGAGCYLYKSFEVFCNESAQDDHVPHLQANNRTLPTLEFSMDLVRVIHETSTVCAYENISMHDGLILERYFSFSQEHNLYGAIGCNIRARFTLNMPGEFICGSSCNGIVSDNGSVSNCMGFNGCCQLSIPKNITSYNFLIEFDTKSSPCSQAFISEKTASIDVHKQQSKFPVILNWVVALNTCKQASITGDNLCGRNSICLDSTKNLGYNCHCSQGYEGNPYLPDGCQVANSCSIHLSHSCVKGYTCVYRDESYKCVSLHHLNSNVLVTLEIVVGLFVFGAIGYWAYIKLARIRRMKRKKMLLIKNGGHLLKQQISSGDSCVMTIKVYTVEEMKKSTRNFSRNTFLGKGGQGTVYKGLFPDGTIVAIKKSSVVDADQVKQFVNEVFILAQINHRNIVKLLGCCLEYDVPLLVYEYLENDTLSQYLHDGKELSPFSWKDRIRITREVAGALAYLHSYASPSIFHRDIKPSNILLDQNYKAVISDFGLSRSVPVCRSHLTTQVEGTFGYLDPEYFQSGKLTAKSDVYSFGVVLTEILTGRKSISSSDSGEGLVPRFKYLVKHNQLVEILDKQVVEEALMDDVLFVAKLAKRCMKTKSKKRPSMKEVAMDLDKLRVD